MGVEHYIVCNQCKEYIDCHKSYALAACLGFERPPIGIEKVSDYYLGGGYWETRGVWFIWKHMGHDMMMQNDESDDWYKLEPHLKEVFPHEEDLKLRGKL